MWGQSTILTETSARLNLLFILSFVGFLFVFLSNRFGGLQWGQSTIVAEENPPPKTFVAGYLKHSLLAKKAFSAG